MERAKCMRVQFRTLKWRWWARGRSDGEENSTLTGKPEDNARDEGGKDAQNTTRAEAHDEGREGDGRQTSAEGRVGDGGQSFGGECSEGERLRLRRVRQRVPLNRRVLLSREAESQTSTGDYVSK